VEGIDASAFHASHRPRHKNLRPTPWPGWESSAAVGAPGRAAVTKRGCIGGLAPEAVFCCGFFRGGMAGLPGRVSARATGSRKQKIFRVEAAGGRACHHD